MDFASAEAYRAHINPALKSIKLLDFLLAHSFGLDMSLFFDVASLMISRAIDLNN